MLQPVSITTIEISDEDTITLARGEQELRHSLVRDLFERHFSLSAQYVARAGGRVNLIGEHVDYPQSQFDNATPAHLFSMGCAVAQEFLVASSFDESGVVRFIHANAGEGFELPLAQLREYEQQAKQEREERVPMNERVLPVWAYHSLGGIAEALNRGAEVKGAQILLTSNVPHGAGMSNSAANLVALGLVLNAAFPSLALTDKTELASFARESENSIFAGGHCGFLDQLLICHSESHKLTKIDYADKNIEFFTSALPEHMQFVAYNTNVPHVLAESDYPVRVAELGRAHAFLSDVLGETINSTTLSLPTINRVLSRFAIEELSLPVDVSGIDKGRDLSEDEMDQIIAQASDETPVILQRLRHQKASSLIVPLAGHAAELGDLDAFGILLNAEGKSLRMSGDFKITGDNGAQDALLDCGFAAAEELGLKAYGRMLGGGGGGNVLFFVDRSDEALYLRWKQKSAELYAAWSESSLQQRITATVIEPIIAPGASLI